jgi:hypothetical protein
VAVFYKNEGSAKAEPSSRYRVYPVTRMERQLHSYNEQQAKRLRVFPILLFYSISKYNPVFALSLYVYREQQSRILRPDFSSIAVLAVSLFTLPLLTDYLKISE